MRTTQTIFMTVKFLVVMCLILVLACAPIQARLDDRLDFATEQAISLQMTCDIPYDLVLDELSSQLVITQHPDGFVAAATKQAFPIGKTLLAYFTQALLNRAGASRLIHLEIIDFAYTFILDGYTAKIDQVTYQAKFVSLEPLGTIEITESLDLPIEEVYGSSDKYFAMNQALRSTTLKFFKEVNSRFCKA